MIMIQHLLINIFILSVNHFISILFIIVNDVDNFQKT